MLAKDAIQINSVVFRRGRLSRRRNLGGWAGLWVVAALVPLLAGAAPELTRYEDILFTLLAVLGLNMIFGYGGEVSIGQPVIVGAAAYAAGVISTTFGWSAYETLPIALFAGVLMSIILNSVSFRLKGWYLAATTFFAVTVFPDLIAVFQHWTGGTDNGLGNIPLLPGMNIGVTGNSIREYEFVLALTLVVFLGVINLLSSRWGTLLQGLRDCHNGVSASGGNQASVRFSLSVVSALPVALSGWLIAHTSGFVGSSQFGLNELLLFAGAVIIGGRGTLWGPVVGAVIFEGISLYIGPFSVVNQLVLGISVLVISATFPVGLVGASVWAWRGGLARWKARSATSTTDRLLGASEVASNGQAVPATTENGAAPSPSALEFALAPSTPKGTMVFEARGIVKSFGGLRAVDGVDLDLVAGQVTGLVGPNGSGKTTLLNVVTGFVPPDEGHIHLRGKDVTGKKAFRIARLGIRRSFQTPQLIGGLSLYDNLALGIVAADSQHVWSALFRGPGYRRRTREIDGIVTPVCQLLGFDADQAATIVEELSLGLRRIAEIGRALVAGPMVICLDEPAAGLGDEELQALETVLRRLADLGYAVLLIEHNLDFVGRVSDIVVSLDLGRVDGVTDLRNAASSGRIDQSVTAAAGSSIRGSFAADAIADAELVRTTVSRDAPEAGGGIGTPALALDVRDLSAWYGEARALFDVSLAVATGEIVGVLGANGAGKSTLLKSIARVHKKTRGTMIFNEAELGRLSSHDVSMLGLGLVREGSIVFPDMTVLEHLKLSRRLCERRGQKWRGEEAVFEWLPALASKRNTKAGFLSGGQRQLLALAAAASAGPKCLLLDEPSAGLSESVLESVFDYIRVIASEGTTLLIAEQSERWLLDLADRTYWLEVGRTTHGPSGGFAQYQPVHEPSLH